MKLRLKLKNRVDVFGYSKPEVEIICDITDPTPIHVYGSQQESFYEGLGIYDADIVRLRDKESVPEQVLEDIQESSLKPLERHEEIYVSPLISEIGLESFSDEGRMEVVEIFLSGKEAESQLKDNERNY